MLLKLYRPVRNGKALLKRTIFGLVAILRSYYYTKRDASAIPNSLNKCFGVNIFLKRQKMNILSDNLLKRSRFLHAKKLFVTISVVCSID